ncbi:CU044_5270 family protein [Actinomadura oligospora]|uniref:CU044_5270 family protein n=1 Tax=Actinomadura oligospora TaxID=111804 RepID=UPI00047DB9A4|nr:CU044_5270 family protein [Actinomadura oligospora]
MNDLHPLHHHHDAQPGPTPEGVDRMRARLNEHIAASDAEPEAARSKAVASTRRHRIRPAWGLAFAGAATAAALAATLVAGELNDAPATNGPAHVTTSPGDSARTVLLTAAEHAETRPTGRYWHVVTTYVRPGASVDAQWMTLDGQYWTAYRNPKPGPGEKGSELLKEKKGVPLMGTVLGLNPPLSALQKLPTDPKALRALAVRNVAKPDMPYSLVEVLIGLLTDQPAPPKVRAAAFRALADVPGVRLLGPATDPRGRKGKALVHLASTPAGGQVKTQLIIDTRTSQVLATTISGSKMVRDRTGAMKRMSAPPSTRLYLAAGWTDESPRIP